MIENDINGWIVDPTDRKAFRCVLDRAILRRMGQSVRMRVEGMDNARVMDRLARR